MKRIAGVVAAVALLVPAAWAVAGNQFEGFIERDHNTYMGLDIVRQDGKRFIARNGLGLGPYVCIGGDINYVMFTTGKKIRIGDDGRFSAKQEGVVDGSDPITVRISGKVNGWVIKGSVGWRYFGGKDPDCYTGQLAYRVSKDTELGG